MLEFTNILKPHKKHVLKTLMIIKSMVCLPYTLTIIQEPTHWTFNVFMNIHYSIGLPMVDRNSLTLAIKWLKRYLLNKRPRGLINYLSSNSHTPPPHSWKRNFLKFGMYLNHIQKITYYHFVPLKQFWTHFSNFAKLFWTLLENLDCSEFYWKSELL